MALGNLQPCPAELARIVIVPFERGRFPPITYLFIPLDRSSLHDPIRFFLLKPFEPDFFGQVQGRSLGC